ncbi:hypothetical protein RJ640_023387 [Escallonia rubra]|uniref:Uncharacterized protein n=1 Tax=Escallonia rubra TaxID=112253 RepID=A0AA88S316_9ASTE|nr:hypothetical protein RJ640_023387 [Escallonia rubra]
MIIPMCTPKGWRCWTGLNLESKPGGTPLAEEKVRERSAVHVETDSSTLLSLLLLEMKTATRRDEMGQKSKRGREPTREPPKVPTKKTK